MRRALQQHRGGKRKVVERNVDPLLRVRNRFKAFLKSIKVLSAFEAMPAIVREQVFKSRGNDPELVFDGSFPDERAFGGAYRELHRKLDGVLDRVRATWHDGDREQTISFSDFVMFALPFWRSVHFNQTDVKALGTPVQPASLKRFMELAAPMLDAMMEESVNRSMFASMRDELSVLLLSRSGLDSRLLYPAFDQSEKVGGRVKFKVVLKARRQEAVSLKIDGMARRLYRVSSAHVWGEPDEATWSGANLGPHWMRELGLKEDARLPVYVQGHALDQLAARLNTSEYARWGQLWMFEALNAPTIAERTSGGDLLVAMKVGDFRVGYLVVTVTNEMVVVRTFLFLTMAQTPEGKQLSRRLKLSRDELVYLGLHEMSRFTQTDLKDDAELRKILSDCGCGQLFTLAEEELLARPDAIRPFAAELKQYVGLNGLAA